MTTLPCACGGHITADESDPGPYVLAHNRTAQHLMAYLEEKPHLCLECASVRTTRPVCQGCLRATAGPLTLAALRELGLSA